MYTSLPPDTRPCVCTTVKKLSRVLGRIYDAQIADSGMNITQFAVLRCLNRRSGEPLAHIAEELEMDRTSLYRAITPMERDGWLTTGEGPSARAKTAKLTPKGRRLLKNADQKWNAMQQRLITRYGAKNYDSLLTDLHRIADCAEEVNRTA